jgi:hypothetical protein
MGSDPNVAGAERGPSKSPVMRPWLPIALVLTSALADLVGAPIIAFYLMLAAVPIVAVGALLAFGELLDERAVAPIEPAAALDALLYGVALLVLIAGAAAGSMVFAVSGCLAVFGLQTLLGAGVELRRPAVLER